MSVKSSRKKILFFQKLISFSFQNSEAQNQLFYKKNLVSRSGDFLKMKARNNFYHLADFFRTRNLASFLERQPFEFDLHVISFFYYIITQVPTLIRKII